MCEPRLWARGRTRRCLIKAGPMIITAPLRASNMSDDQLSPEQQLAAQQQLLKILPYILGFGWVVMIPISYLFIAPVLVEGLTWQLLVTAGITLATGVVDIIFYRIFANSVRQEPTEFAKILE